MKPTSRAKPKPKPKPTSRAKPKPKPKPTSRVKPKPKPTSNPKPKPTSRVKPKPKPKPKSNVKQRLKPLKTAPSLKSVSRILIDGRYRYFDNKSQSEITTGEYRRRKKIQTGVYKARLRPKKKPRDRVTRRKFNTIEGRDYLHAINFDCTIESKESLYQITEGWIESLTVKLSRLKRIPDYSFFVRFNGLFIFGLTGYPASFTIGEFDLSELILLGVENIIGTELRSKIDEIYLRMMTTSDAVKFETYFIREIQFSIRKEIK